MKTLQSFIKGKIIFLFLIISFTSMVCFPQERAILPKELRDKSVKKLPPVCDNSNYSFEFQNPGNSNNAKDEAIGETWYDLQTNYSCQNRIFLYPDGYVGGTFTMGFNYPNFSSRGTGFNKFSGSSWGSYPSNRIENERCGWPSYAPWGSSGEVVASHTSSSGIKLSKRNTKGIGSWSYSTFPGPSGHTELLWPRMTTNGNDHSVIHLIALTAPVGNGGSIYQGQDGALLYSRSNNGGASWEIQNDLLPGLGSSYYKAITADEYEFAYPKGNTLAILVGGSWMDLVLLKSTNGGDSWSKTTVWKHPYPLWDGDPTEKFYCPDGSHSIAIDNSGKVHIAFGINRAYSDGETQFWYPLIDGLGYWNEDMPTFSNNLNALNPYGEPGSELIEDYNLIGWMQDVNNNGELDILGDIGLYYIGGSSMPQIVVDNSNRVHVVFSAITEGYDNGVQDYRHLWLRSSEDNGLSWDDFQDLNSDIAFTFSECVFPSCSPTTDSYLHFIFQEDYEPGMAVRGDEDYFGENFIKHLKVYLGEMNQAPDIEINTTSITIHENKKNQNIYNQLEPVDLKNKKKIDPQFITDTIYEISGDTVLRIIVPGKPPDNFRMPKALHSKTAITLDYVPAYDWSFGCSATAAAMMAGYYDHNGFPNMYDGPTNGGVAPLDNSIWGSVIINGEVRKQCPLSATRKGLDGRNIRGHVDDYWIEYGSSLQDPYIGNWPQHTYGECTGDFMKTNQSEYDNPDGATSFYYLQGGLSCSSTNPDDGCYGLKLFFESRSYTVNEYFNQWIYGYNGQTIGFTYNKYKQQIDEGRPVIIHIQGHSMLGYGYNSANNTIYIHDTWDHSDHQMQWGGSYHGEDHYAVSIIHLSGGGTTANYFTLSNIGNDELNVFDIETNKPWLGANGYPSLPFVLSPSNNQAVNIDINWLQLNTPQTGTIYVNSNDPDEPIKEIPVTAIPSSPFFINEHGLNDAFKFYPNPVEDKLIIENMKGDFSIKLNLIIYDLTGKEVITESISEKITQLDLKNLSTGMYFAKIGTDTDFFTKKIVKK
ncbi:MAG: T9SS type A sorting domain-containing protein [Bacteroidales bacterium]|nr:T9SS type A sorting domain-containing protein [Bacteroidales bacterium]